MGRMDRFVRLPETEQKKSTCTFTCSFPLVLPSRGIPDLRRADPGPKLMVVFKGATRTKASSRVGIEEFFHDPMRRSLINKALAGNREPNKLDRTLSRTTIQRLESANVALILALFEGSWQRMSDKPTI